MTLKTLDQLQAEQAKALADLQAQHTIAAALPEGVTASHIMPSAATGSPWVSVKVRGIAGAAELLRKFVVVPFAEYRNGCLKLSPLECLPAAEKETNAASWACHLDVSQSIGSYAPSARLVFFARLPDVGLVRVNADVEGPDYIGGFSALSAEYRIHAGRVVRGSVRVNNKLRGHSDKYVKWAGGSEEHASFSFLFGADQYDEDQPGDTLSHALATLRNMSDEFDRLPKA